MKAVFRYPGSKWSIAQRIIALFPENYENMVYLEPFLGSGAVFFNKKPGIVETINDLDGDVVNLFRVIRERPDDLARAIDLTPYSRQEYDLAFEPCNDSLERARRFLVKTNQAIGAKMGHKCGWRNHKQEKIGGTACKWRGVPDVIRVAASRLQGTQSQLVQIECQDALALIERYNRPEVLMYLDPPYVRSTRRSGRLYSNEMRDEDHQRLLDCIVGSRAKIIISGYASDLYDNALCGWTRITMESRITSGETAEEVVWMNYSPPDEQISIFEERE